MSIGGSAKDTKALIKVKLAEEATYTSSDANDKSHN
jgi:hypothetical protein